MSEAHESRDNSVLIQAAQEYARAKANACLTYRGLNHSNCPSSVECVAPSHAAVMATYARHYDNFFMYHNNQSWGR
jgi:hypothetical protein